jgi:hypothetical protein
MPSAKVEVRLDTRLINPMLANLSDATAKRAAIRVRDRARSNVVAKGRVNTGRLLHSITARSMVRPAAGSARYAVGSSLDYASYQEEGIGPVHARPGHVLRFRPKGSAVFIFRPRTRGFPGAHFMRDAYRSIKLQDFLP